MSELIWLRHNEHGGAAQFPADVADLWALKGWEPCEAPIDADPAMAEHVAPSLATPNVPADLAGPDETDEE